MLTPKSTHRNLGLTAHPLSLLPASPSLPLPPAPHKQTDATSLDLWVLSQLRTLLHNATSNAELDRELREEGVVFFLHLLGLDTTGHAWRPFSKVRFGLHRFLALCYAVSRDVRASSYRKSMG